MLIGINEYPEWGGGRQLRGAVNDVNAVERLLVERFGFSAQKSILKLTSPADDEGLLANRDNILRAFRTHLIENDRIGAGDVVVVYYSGHGSWVRDENQDEQEDEFGGLRLARDETLVPCDSGSDHARDIVDDELAELLGELTERTRNVSLFFDSCHSATMTRWLPEAEDAQDRARVLPPPPDALEGLARSSPPAGRGTRSLGGGGWLLPSDDCVVISACRASERARERRFVLGGFKYHGILTFCLLKSLRDAGPKTTYYDVWDDVRVEVNKLCHEQHPQIEGPFERKVFGGEMLPRKRYVEVAERGTDTVALAAGLVHGCTLGSRFAIFPKGLQVFEDREVRVAVVRLVEVHAFTSVGAVEEGAVLEVEIGAPAVEIEHDYGSMQMAVRVIGDDAVLAAVRRGIETSPLLTLAESGEQPSVATVRLCYPPKPSGGEDTTHGEMLCILSSSNGHQLANPTAPGADGPASVLGKLADIARCHNLLAIHNTDRQSDLRGKVRLRLVEEGRRPVERDEGGGIVLQVRDRVYLEVENRSDQDLHVGVFNFLQPEWKLRILFPPRGAQDDVVQAHSSRRITQRFRVEWPAGYPTDENVPLPQDTTKLFATTSQVDFHSYWLSRMRATRGRASLPRLLALAGVGGPEPATRALDEAEEDWTTTELVFQIVP